jgi:putative spermidine/putrescine transport system substrate-binding protein
MRISRLAAAGAATTVVVLALAGCSTSATPAGGGAEPGDSSGPQTINIAGFSGAFADQFQAEVIDPFEEEFPEISVVYTPAANSAELLAELRTNTTRATNDLVIIDSSVAVTANEEGLFEELDSDLVPNLADLVDDAVVQEGFGPAITIDSLAYVYNPSIFDEAPATWQGMNDEEYAGQLALQIADTRGIALIAGLSKEQGVDYQDGIDEQLAELADIAPLVQTFQPQPNIYDAIRSGSVGLGVGWNARAQALSDETPDSIAVSVPEAAGVAQISTLNLVATSEKKDAAQSFINYAISAEAQQRLAEEAYYGPVNVNAELPADLVDRVATEDGLLEDAAPIDWAWIAPNYADWVQRIQREVIGG